MTRASGGTFYFQYGGAALPKSIAPGVELKGDGGYVVAAPSLHPSGKRYEFDWLAGKEALLNVAPAPDWLKEAIAAVRTNDCAQAEPIAPGEKWPEGQRNNKLASIAGTMRRRGLSREAIEAALLEENRLRGHPPLPEDEVCAIAASVARYEPAAEGTGASAHSSRVEVPGEWPETEPIEEELPPVEAFSEDLLPRSFRHLVADISERMQVPPDFPAVSLVIGLAGVVSRRAIMQPLANDTSWTTPPNIWGGLVADPSSKKTPTVNTTTGSLEQIQAEWRHEYEEAQKIYAAQKERHGLRRGAWKEQFKSASKKGDAEPVCPEDEPEEPTLRRLIVNDSTGEALHENLAANPAGLLLKRDELTGLLSRLDQEQFGSEGAFYLSAWDGNTSHTSDRISRGITHAPHCCLSILGGIQPARLRHYLVDAIKDGPANDGLIQRFQLLVWPDKPTDWRLIDRKPNATDEETVSRVFRKLVHLDCDSPLRARFDPEAQELFNAWLTNLEKKLLAGGLHPALVSHLAKYRSLMPSLALLFELADQAASDDFDVFVGSRSGESRNFWVGLNHAQQVEICFSGLERDVIARGIFTSVSDLRRKMMRYIRLYAKTAKPFRWKFADPTRRIKPW